MKKKEKSRRYWEKRREREQEMAEREDDGRGQSSHCKFYKDGKCSRVCTFPCIERFSLFNPQNIWKWFLNYDISHWHSFIM